MRRRHIRRFAVELLPGSFRLLPLEAVQVLKRYLGDIRERDARVVGATTKGCRYSKCSCMGRGRHDF